MPRSNCPTGAGIRKSNIRNCNVPVILSGSASVILSVGRSPESKDLPSLSSRPSVASGGICCTASPFIERGMENRSCYRKRIRFLFHSSFLCSNAGSSRMLSCHLERQSRGLTAKADSSTPVLRTSARNDIATPTSERQKRGSSFSPPRLR